MEDSSEKIRCGRRFGIDSESYGCLGEPLGSLDLYHHPDAGEILTTTTCNSMKEDISQCSFHMLV